MDVEKLIQAARCCTSGGEGCDKCPMNDYIGMCNLARHSLTARKICEIADHYEALLKAERSKVVQEARAWVEQQTFYGIHAPKGIINMDADKMRRKLDSMEPDKEQTP